MIGFTENVSGRRIVVVRKAGGLVVGVRFSAPRQGYTKPSLPQAEMVLSFEGKDDFLEKLLSIPQEVADFSEEEFLLGWLRGFRGFFGAEAVELFDKEENGECGDDKADDIGEEEAVVDGWRSGLLCGFERGECFFGEIPVEFGEVDFVEDEPQGRHHNVGNERGDNFPKSGADNNTDREIDDVSFYGKFFEFFDERCHRTCLKRLFFRRKLFFCLSSTSFESRKKTIFSGKTFKFSVL